MNHVDIPTNPTVLSLCAGIGGLDLGIGLAFPGARTIGFVEREAACCEILVSRMEEGRLDPAPIWTDVKTFDGRPWRGAVDILCAGYPCQPFSTAGKRQGDKDPRHLWPDIRRIVGEVRPKYAVFENVQGHVSKGLREVLENLMELGYCCEWGVYSAAQAGATHRRNRVFILAYSRRAGPQGGDARPGESRGASSQGAAATPERAGLPLAHCNSVGRREVGEQGGELRGMEEGTGPPRAEGREQAIPPERSSEQVGDGGEVADSAGLRWEQPTDGQGQETPRTDGPGSEDLADSLGAGERRGDEPGPGEEGSETRQHENGTSASDQPSDRGEDMADSGGCGRGKDATTAQGWEPDAGGGCAVDLDFPPGPEADWSGIPEELWPATEPALRGVADGVPVRVDQLRALGNAVVPQQAALAIRELWGRLSNHNPVN